MLPGGRRGALLVHGFTGSPSEMRLLGEYLNRLGFTVLAPRLYGHGSVVGELAEARWAHWYVGVEDAYHLLAGICEEIVVVGLSMGALLGMKLSEEYRVEKIVSLNAPIYIADKRLRLLPLAKMFRAYVPKKNRQASKAMLAEDGKYLIGYDYTPLKSLASLVELIADVKKMLPEFRTPALVVQSVQDRTVKPESARYIYDTIKSADKELLWFYKAGHIVTLGVEREQVFAAVGNFLC